MSSDTIISDTDHYIINAFITVDGQQERRRQDAGGQIVVSRTEDGRVVLRLTDEHRGTEATIELDPEDAAQLAEDLSDAGR
jgi:hypothetical protein